VAAIESVWSILGMGYSVSAFTRIGSRPALRRLESLELHPIAPPEQGVEESVRDLRVAMRDSGAGALMPLDDAALWLCRRACEGTPWALVGPGGRQAEVALDKRLQCEAAAAAGFAVPETRFLEAPFGPVPGARFPLVVRPAVAAEERAGRLVTGGAARTCADESELVRALEGFDPGCTLMVQPRLLGTGEGIFGLATPDGVVGWSAHRRIRMMNPAGSGSSACISIPVDESVRGQAERMLDRLEWSGLFMIETLRDRDGKPWFVELNGRAWGSMALARAVGLEYPAWAVGQAFGEMPTVAPIGAGGEGVCARHVGREIVHLLAVLRGNRSRAAAWPSRLGTVREVLRWHRGDRPYNWRRGELPVFLDDTVSTVVGAVRGSRRTDI
jgi:hypothetical protein